MNQFIEVLTYFSGKKFLLILVFIMLLPANSCFYYRSVEINKSPFDVLSDEKNGNFYIIHKGDSVWRLDQMELSETYIRGYLETLVGHRSYETLKPYWHERFYQMKNQKPSEEVIDEVHIYINSYTSLGHYKANIDTSQIDKIVLHNIAAVPTITTWLIGSAATAAGAFVIYEVISFLIKGISCPFIYIHDGNDYLLAGEIYSGAIYPCLEREDYFRLDGIATPENTYKLLISNEVEEIQYTNSLELLYVDHKADEEVLFDKYGQLHTLNKKIAPQKAHNLLGERILEMVMETDNLYYSGFKINKDSPIDDGVILEFDIPEGVSNIDLGIRAKNSFWLEYVYKSFYTMLGERYSTFKEKKSELGREMLTKEMIDQKLPILVYLETNNGWEYHDYFSMAGPIEFRDDILSIPVEKVNDSKLRIKLSYGVYFWEIDKIYCDIDSNQHINVGRIPLKSVINDKGVDLTEKLGKADSLYYVQPEIGDHAYLEFEVPDMSEDSRTVFLHSQGYYTTIKESVGKVQMGKLKRIQRNGGLPYLSKDLAISLENQLARK